jgi:hypothetical protein
MNSQFYEYQFLGEGRRLIEAFVIGFSLAWVFLLAGIARGHQWPALHQEEPRPW